jgi:hypothetical protein
MTGEAHRPREHDSCGNVLATRSFHNANARGEPGMRRLTNSVVLLAAALAVGFLAVGCGAASSISNAIKSAAPSVTLPTGPTTGPTAPPTTEAPTTEAPTTVPPTTAPPTTAAPTTAAPTVSPSPAASAASSLLWLWILIAAVVIIGIIILVMVARSSSRRRSAVAGDWRQQTIDAYAQGSALYDAMNVAERPGALAADDSGARWADIQRRADDLAQRLYAMRESAPDEDERARVADTLGALQAVRSAMDAERAPGGADPRQAEVVRGRLYAFDAALRALRPPDPTPRY